jgi:hypothetical protein
MATVTGWAHSEQNFIGNGRIELTLLYHRIGAAVPQSVRVLAQPQRACAARLISWFMLQ